MFKIRFAVAMVASLIFVASASATTVKLDSGALGGTDFGPTLSPVSGLTIEAQVGARLMRRSGPPSLVASATGLGIQKAKGRDKSGISAGERMKFSLDSAEAGDSMSLDLANFNLAGPRRARDRASLTVWFDGDDSATKIGARAVARALTDNGGGSVSLLLADVLGADASRLVSSFSINAPRRGRVNFEAAALSYGGATTGVPTSVANPEPVTASLAMLGMGALTFAATRRRREV